MDNLLNDLLVELLHILTKQSGAVALKSKVNISQQITSLILAWESRNKS